LKILQIVSSTTTSGAERNALDLSKELVRRGHFVEVITPERGWLPRELERFDIPATQRNMKKAGWHQTLGYVIRRLRQGKFDLVHSHLSRATYFGAIGGMFAGVPAVSTVHIGNHDRIYRWMARGDNRLIAVSNYVRGLLHGREISDRFIETIYNGTDFCSMPRRAHLGSGSGFQDRVGPKFGLIGRVCPEKGHREMILALKEIRQEFPTCHAFFVGRIIPSFEPELQSLIFETGLSENITLSGEQEDISSILDGLNFTVLPSHKETFGIAAIESMARERPVVASRVGGLPEIVRHEQNGLLVDLKPSSIAEACCRLISNQTERETYGVAGREVVEKKFTLGRMVDQVEALYSGISRKEKG
jgi:glycosyltransferase involved in cell wall biosynthesis